MILFALQAFYVFFVFYLATGMLPADPGLRHYLVPVTFASACFYAMRGGAFVEPYTWLDVVIVSSLIVGYITKIYRNVRLKK